MKLKEENINHRLLCELGAASDTFLIFKCSCRINRDTRTGQDGTGLFAWKERMTLDALGTISERGHFLQVSSKLIDEEIAILWEF